MNTQRRKVLQGIGAAGAALAAQPYLSFPAIAQNKPLRIGIIAPKAGIAGTIGECGLRGTLFAVERINAAGGIAGRKVELVVEEETNPKDSIERLRKLVLQDKVDCVQGIVSSGVSLAMGAVAEEMKALTIFWDGTTQDGVNETMPNPRYVFRSTDNECEAVMASLLAIKHWKGKFATVAGINPDYSYGRNNFAAFQALLKKFGVEHKIVADQWPKVGTLDLTSHVAALKAAKPDLVFSSLLFADLPVFMKTAHGAGLMDGKTKFVFPAAGFQHTLLKKEFTPEGMIFGHNTLYFNLDNPTPLQKAFVQDYEAKYKDYPHWEADRAYFAMQVYRAGVEAAYKAKNAWPGQEDIINAMEGLKVDSLGGPGAMRKDHIADQTFYQGMTTHANRFDFATITDVTKMYSDQLQKPQERTSGSGSRRRTSSCRNEAPTLPAVAAPRGGGAALRAAVRAAVALIAFFDVLIGGVFHASVLFLVAAGLQLVFGVQRIVNLACGSFYALGAYFGITAVNWTAAHGAPGWSFLPVLIASGIVLGAIGPFIERLLRTVYRRDEAFQLLLTFALVLMFQDVLRFFWGANPQQLGNLSMSYGKVTLGEVSFPTYNVLVMAASLAIAVSLGLFLKRTRYGRILRATAENREMAEALGADVKKIYAGVFTLGTILGTVGGALVVPTAAASLDMPVELVVEAFAVVVIGGLGSMRGALAGALVVGLTRALAITFYAELEVLAIYVIVIAVLVARPAGLFGKPVE